MKEADENTWILVKQIAFPKELIEIKALAERKLYGPRAARNSFGKSGARFTNA